jgi:hypothetical protein
MKPGTLCIVEPTPANPVEALAAEQIGGLIVTAHEQTWPSIWSTKPPLRVRIDQRWCDATGKPIRPGVVEIGVMESWLRPLRGEPAPERIDANEVAHA